MAHLHVLETTDTGGTLVVHVAIPATNNSVGLAWRTALTRSGLGGATVLPDGDGTQGTVSAAEKVDIVSGAVYERVIQVKRIVKTNAALDAFYTAVQGEILAQLQTLLQFYGKTRP